MKLILECSRAEFDACEEGLIVGRIASVDVRVDGELLPESLVPVLVEGVSGAVAEHLGVSGEGPGPTCLLCRKKARKEHLKRH